jgi:hypothetical protein
MSPRRRQRIKSQFSFFPAIDAFQAIAIGLRRSGRYATCGFAVILPAERALVLMIERSAIAQTGQSDAIHSPDECWPSLSASKLSFTHP